jgi:hypothetical protein
MFAGEPGVIHFFGDKFFKTTDQANNYDAFRLKEYSQFWFTYRKNFEGFNLLL